MTSLPPEKESSEQNKKTKGEKPSGPTFWYLLIGLIVAILLWSWVNENGHANELTFGKFVRGLKSGEFNSQNVHELRLGLEYITFQDQPKSKSTDEETASAESQDSPTEESSSAAEESSSHAETVASAADSEETAEAMKRYRIPVGGISPQDLDKLTDLLEESGIDFTGTSPQTEWGTIFSIMLMAAVVLIFIVFLRRMGGPGQAMSFGRSRGRLMAEDDVKVTFDDVAGIDEAVEELREVVEFLRTPGKYQALGGRIPRGVLLVGPPGTGKTLLAKAVAGEAGVPFFSLSGSDFVEMFVGVGAARVRDMFAQAVQKSPSIIFIDELDALGKTRGSGMPGGHDEREQTLNALLVEMDGFSSDQSVIVMGATNRPETLDPALMRPGRFDRHVLVDRADYKGREKILQVHAQKIKMDDDVDLKRIAKLTPGFVGADLANLVNEAALLAARANKSAVSMVEFEEGIERVVAGLEKSSRLIQEDEKLRVAYHECGHALVASSLPQTDPVHKISIIPRGFGALGYMLQRPEDDRHLVTQTELENRICVALGGIAAEELFFDETSSGPQNDLEQSTSMARRMVMEFGMSPKLGRVNYRESKRSPFLQGVSQSSAEFAHSEQTLREIDLEVRRIIDEAMETAREIVRSQKNVLEEMTQELLKKEVMNSDELKEILDRYKTGPQLKPGTSVAKRSGDAPASGEESSETRKQGTDE
ncbi:ATP-dependent zinc metalloprotease FtsH [Thalassoglobus sp. JC818]|uniref:ATP-dependent zinc metalloprotease FtsH n=1 Tax=Thalassoglobus sp. JC818 TaxID=3232136 RepID=UPI003457D0FA